LKLSAVGVSVQVNQGSVPWDADPPLEHEEVGDGAAVVKKGTIITLHCFICMPLG